MVSIVLSLKSSLFLMNALQLGQIFVALISLTYTVNDGKTYNDTYFSNGPVNVANLTGYFNGDRLLSAEDNQALAHTYGETSQSNKECESYEDIADVYRSPNNPPYFCRRTVGKHEFAYRFKEYNPKDIERDYPSFTHRIITTSSGVCLKYTELGQSDGLDLNKNMAAKNFAFFNSTYKSNISIPISHLGWASTTYIYRGPDIPSLDQDNSCGARCLWIWAHRDSVPNNNVSTFFQCPITISEVSNMTTDLYNVPDSVARVAAASIALQGRWVLGPQPNTKIWTQYQFYAIKYVKAFSSLKSCVKWN